MDVEGKKERVFAILFCAGVETPRRRGVVKSLAWTGGLVTCGVAPTTDVPGVRLVGSIEIQGPGGWGPRALKACIDILPAGESDLLLIHRDDQGPIRPELVDRLAELVRGGADLALPLLDAPGPLKWTSGAGKAGGSWVDVVLTLDASAVAVAAWPMLTTAGRLRRDLAAVGRDATAGMDPAALVERGGGVVRGLWIGGRGEGADS